MLFLNKTCLADIKEVGYAHINKGVERLPLVVLKPKSNKKVFLKLLNNEPYTAIQFYYISKLRTLSLGLHRGKYKLGIIFDLNAHLQVLTGIMLTNQIVITNENKDFNVSINIETAVNHFEAEFKSNLIPEILEYKLREKDVSISNFDEVKNNFI